ncbi:hypothetical protein A0J61_07431 [Choanephora cucurbitarum]|uniref:Queuosine 5'-phosphate N-glycosylase/hydrolase n=1 Tax=Choanephora cucurbitarum TaxID=101091 RepID=A0A1C7N5U4_9FUNG|nr:hypothetical protein A0J61_07431 [Choanephora cucurbitarum]
MSTTAAKELNAFVSSLPEGNYVEAVRSSCTRFIEQSAIVIAHDAIDRFLTQLDKQQYKELAYDSTMKMPLRFDTLQDEINFVTFIDLLNFGSGFRVPLHHLADRGAFDAIRFGAMSFHISGKSMDADTFKNMTIFEVAEIFQLPIDREVRHEKLDFVTLTEPTALKPFAAGLTAVLNTTGDYLVSHKHKDLADFILYHVNQKPQDATYLVSQLVQAFPGLQDSYQFPNNPEPVYLYKKAQIIVYHLWFTFREQSPEQFDFKDIDQLTVFSDNVIPTMLIELGAITQIPESWQQAIQANEDLSIEAATTLRAAGVVACDAIAK